MWLDKAVLGQGGGVTHEHKLSFRGGVWGGGGSTVCEFLYEGIGHLFEGHFRALILAPHPGPTILQMCL